MAAAVPGSLPAGHERLLTWERKALFGLLVLVSALGVLVVHRSAFQESRRTDATVYFRAAWALRAGANIYEVPDDNNLHYAYPPLLAILLAPLADGPAVAPRAGMLPYPVSISLWILLSVAATFLALHWFAQGLEESATDPALRNPPAGCRRWWMNRVLPFLICAAPVGCTFSRGQVTPFLLACIAGMYLALVRGRHFRSGLWLAAAICLKVIPALLVLYPLWRRDGRSLAGVLVGAVVGAVLIPALALGPQQAVEVNRQFVEHVLKPGLDLGGESTLFEEMMSMRRTGCQSLRAILHNYQHWDRTTRPDRPNTLTTLGHYGSALVLVGGMVLAFGWRRPDDSLRTLTMLGGLLTVMILISPESHTHYFCFPIPLIMALAHGSVAARPERLWPTARTLGILLFAGVSYALVMIPFWEMRREAGIPLWGSLVLWTAAIVQLRAAKAAVPTRQRGNLAQAA